MLNASTGGEIDAAFATLLRERPDALFVGGDPFFTSQPVQFASLASRHAIPMAHSSREAVEAGGLMSYAHRMRTDMFRQVGAYTGQHPQRRQAHRLPVMQSTKFELVINLKTARALGLQVPDRLLTLADEVIE